MTISWKIYMMVGAVLILSFLSPFFLPVNDIIKGALATPGIGALFYALYQISRDQAKYEKDLAMQQKQEIFNLGVTSHMANVAFDKHVEFCEKYISKVNESIEHLFKDYPPNRTDAIAVEMMNIRRKYTPWLDKVTVTELHELENYLAGIGIAIHEIEGNVIDEQGKSELKSQIEHFREKIFGHTFDINQMGSDTACAKIVHRLQDTLGITELTLLRKKYVEMALVSLEEK